MPAYVSLFRGINVGGHNQVRMAELKALHESLGLKNVLPYIQSGNVVFTSHDTDMAQLQKQIEDGFEKRFGFHAEVLIRTSAQLSEIIENNPFQGHHNKESNRIVVIFLASHPEATAQENLLKTFAGPEEIFFIGKELYIYYPNGMGRSKLSGTFIEKKLKTFGTARNLNTVLQLHKLMQ